MRIHPVGGSFQFRVERPRSREGLFPGTETVAGSVLREPFSWCCASLLVREKKEPHHFGVRNFPVAEGLHFGGIGGQDRGKIGFGQFLLG